MSWCDKLFSVPGVGLTLDSHFASGDALLDSISPILNKIGEGQTITINKHESFVFSITLDNGFTYMLEHSRVYVGFQHRMRFRAVSGGLPVGELLSTAQPFTEMLPLVAEKLIDVSVMLPRANERNIKKIGIVSTTQVDEIDLPPGIRRFIDYIGRPWNKMTEGFNIGITSIINTTDDYSDVCVHQLRKSEDDEKLMVVQLDWQRRFTHPKLFNKASIEKDIRLCEKAALSYFEDVAEGNRFDEQIIAAATDN